jgi:hypothetical protein
MVGGEVIEIIVEVGMVITGADVVIDIVGDAVVFGTVSVVTAVTPVVGGLVTFAVGSVNDGGAAVFRAVDVTAFGSVSEFGAVVGTTIAGMYGLVTYVGIVELGSGVDKVWVIVGVAVVDDSGVVGVLGIGSGGVFRNSS